MRDYVSKLSERGEMRVIDREVDPRFELAAVTQVSQRESELPILFRRVKGSDFPVVTNLYGSRARLCELIGAEDMNYCRRWTELVEGEAENAGLQSVAAGELQRGKLSDLPLVTYFERDAGPYFTSAIYLAREPETGTPNLSFHRSMYVSDGELRVRLGSSHDLAGYKAKADARDEPMEAALLIGTPPEVFLAAAASLAYKEDELVAAGRIAGRPIAMRPCKTIDLEVPAATEIVVEGRFLPNELRPEGPFGEFMGYYVPVADNVVFQISEVSWREDALFHSLLCGTPEDICPLELSIAARIYRHLTARLPGIVDVACHAALLNTVIKLRQPYEGHARHALLAAFGAHMDYSKACIAVDEDVDIHDLEDVMWAYLTRGRADRRAFILDDVPGFYRDPSGDHWGRLAIDATKPWGREAEFERKRIPDAAEIELADYL
jgi:4-hydroxybenzoate decarboxylase